MMKTLELPVVDPDRYFARCVRTPSGCLEWQGSRAWSGHAHARVGKRAYSVSRLVLRALVGPPPFELTYACHHCDNPPCIEPSHLYWGTPKDNTRDAMDRGLFNPSAIVGIAHAASVDAKLNAKTCVRGHEWDEKNTYWEQHANRTRLARRCRACAADRARERRHG